MVQHHLHHCQAFPTDVHEVITRHSPPCFSLLVNLAKSFMENFRSDHLEMHSQDIARLTTITDPQHVAENELAQMYKTNKYHLRLTPVSFELLIAFLEDNKFMVLLRIVNQHLDIQGECG
jgi:transcription initiation factor TFIID subunit 5